MPSWGFGQLALRRFLRSRNIHTYFRQGQRDFLDEITQQYEAKMSDDEVNHQFMLNEVSRHIDKTPITSFCANQISVNRPVEDRWNVSFFGTQMPRFCPATSIGGYLFSVTDGHAGHACAHSVSMRQPDYVAVSLLDMDPNGLEAVRNELKMDPIACPSESYLGDLKPWGTLSNDVWDMHGKQIRRFVDELLSFMDEFDDLNAEQSLYDALTRLDMDMVSAALPTSRASLNRALLRIVLSGAVNTLVYLPTPGTDLYLTQVGDCEAVIGSWDDDTWLAEKLLEPHNANNEAEVERIKSEHPINEASFLLRDDRLLGELMPLRAFGDVRYKWRGTDLKYVSSLLNIPPSYPVMPSFYYTPPYLIAKPQVVHRKLTPGKERFVILATDGLWDALTPGEAVKVVADNLARGDEAPNAATQLIKAALGGNSDSVVDYRRISSLLSMPANVARYYRDDISVVVIFLNQDSAEH